jgi:hypothetical protein
LLLRLLLLLLLLLWLLLLLLLLWLEEGPPPPSLRSPGLELSSVVVLAVSSSSLTEDWADIFGLVWPAEVAAGCCSVEDKDEVDEVLTAGVRHFDLAFPLLLLLLRVLLTAAGEDEGGGDCCCWL